jgi:two-component system, LytTR family, sensor kinase
LPLSFIRITPMETPYSTKSLAVASIISCLILGAVNTYVVRSFGFPFQAAFKDALGNLFFWILGSAMIGNTLRFYFPRQSRFIFLGGLIVSNAALWVLITGMVLPYWLRNEPGYKPFFEQSLTVRIAFSFLLFSAVSMLFAFLYTLKDQQGAEQRKQEALELARQTELNNLQEKLHPHFLFNSLNSINALVAFQPEKARQMVQQLSDFLRGTLRRDSEDWITLEQELQYLSLYLDIEKVRFGHRLKTGIQVGEHAGNFKLPPFILLPLLENAIKFGLYDTLDEITIVLTAGVSGSMLEVNISNPFDPETAGQFKGTGFGLKSVNRRLYLLFNRSDLLKTFTKDSIFTTTVFIPQNT